MKLELGSLKPEVSSLKSERDSAWTLWQFFRTRQASAYLPGKKGL
jgi:hypothetical protein